jgi:peptidoglycan/xylan/chitin deacetylase (PgdA/CDA1 family)
MMPTVARALPHPPLAVAYHGISAEVEQPGSTLLLHPRHLRSHVRMLQRRGYRFLTASELADLPAPRPRTAVLTFDDGWLDGLTTVAPLLAGLGVRATFYVNAGLLGGQHDIVVGEAGRLLDEHGVGSLHSAGMELGSHAMSHCDLTLLDDERLAYELGASKQRLEQLTGTPCRTFAYPFGLHDERVERAVENAGYDLAFSWEPGPWRRFAAPRIPSPTRYGGWALALKMLGVRRPSRRR